MMSDVMFKQVTRNNQGDDHDGCGNQQLPRPLFALEKKWHGRQYGPDDSADGLGAKADDDARHETAEAAKQAQIGHIALGKHLGVTHHKAPDATGDSDEDPHQENAVGFDCHASCPFVVLVHEVGHQWCAKEWDDHPYPLAPGLVDQFDCQELQHEICHRRIAPGEEQVLTRWLFAIHDLTAQTVYHAQFVF